MVEWLLFPFSPFASSSCSFVPMLPRFAEESSLSQRELFFSWFVAPASLTSCELFSSFVPHLGFRLESGEECIDSQDCGHGCCSRDFPSVLCECAEGWFGKHCDWKSECFLSTSHFPFMDLQNRFGIASPPMQGALRDRLSAPLLVLSSTIPIS